MIAALAELSSSKGSQWSDQQQNQSYLALRTHCCKAHELDHNVSFESLPILLFIAPLTVFNDGI